MVDDAAVLWLRRSSQLKEPGTQENEGCIMWLDDDRAGHILALPPESADAGVGFVDAHEGRMFTPTDADALGDGAEDGGNGRGVVTAEKGFVGGTLGG